MVYLCLGSNKKYVFYLTTLVITTILIHKGDVNISFYSAEEFSVLTQRSIFRIKRAFLSFEKGVSLLCKGRGL